MPEKTSGDPVLQGTPAWKLALHKVGFLKLTVLQTDRWVDPDPNAWDLRMVQGKKPQARLFRMADRVKPDDDRDEDDGKPDKLTEWGRWLVEKVERGGRRLRFREKPVLA